MGIMFSPIQVVRDIWLSAVIAYGVSIVLTPVVRRLAYRYKIVDRPDDLLKPHGRPIAYLGGISICMGFLVATVLGMVWYPRLWRLAIAICASTIVIVLTGLLDDLKNLKPRQKVLGQILAAAILFAGLCTIGVHLEAARMFQMVLHISMPKWLVMVLSGGLTVLVVIATCNATNLLDGLDGLCGGVTGIIAVAFAGLTVYLACYGHHAEGGLDKFRVILCLAMAGAVLGFLPYNIPPASIFLGDSGSMLLGFFVATMMMLFTLEGTARWFLAASVIFGLPIIDTALAVVRRLSAGVSIFAGDRSHLYDQLVDRGMSIRKVVGLFYFLALLASAIGFLQAVFLRGRYALLLDVGILFIVGIIFVKKGMVHPKPRKK